MNSKAKRIMQISLALICLSAATAGREASIEGESAVAPTAKQVYEGNIIYFGGPRRSTVTTFRMTVDSFTSDAEVARLGEILKSGGQDALLKEISKEKRGTIQIGTQLGRDLNAVWVSEGPEGERKITGLSERWIGISETRRGARSLDYPFTFVELYIESNGKGDGELIPAAKVRVRSAKTWEVENFGIYPARLTEVRGRTR